MVTDEFKYFYILIGRAFEVFWGFWKFQTFNSDLYN